MTTIAEHESPAARRSRWRDRRTWALLALAVLVVGIITIVIQGATRANIPGRYDPDNHGPDGFHALAQVLRDQGVDVQVTGSYLEAGHLLAGGDATLAMVDAPALTDETVSALMNDAATTVLLDPSSRTLELGVPGAQTTGWGAAPAVTADCSLPELADAGSISSTTRFSGGAISCFPGPNGDGAGLVAATTAGRTVIAIDSTELFTNATILDHDNASVALRLLGQHRTLVWYVPSFTDADVSGTPSLADLTPGWVTPVLLLGAVVAITAAIWRGRRFGPLVAERLPVTVRVSETMEGRARLYARGRDAAHTADVLRRDTARRIGRMLGLGSKTPPAVVAEAAAAAIGASRDVTAGILSGPAPRADIDLLDLSDRLSQLEAAVRAAVRTERKPS